MLTAKIGRGPKKNFPSFYYKETVIRGKIESIPLSRQDDLRFKLEPDKRHSASRTA